MSDTILGEFEQVVMLGVLHCGADAYGVPVWREIEARARRAASIAAVYKTLDRLEVKGYVRSRVGEPTAARGGRAKRVYQLTSPGLRTLKASLRALTSMTAGLEGVLGAR
jgi:PadR family transcriptional regulator, regulatory protein PadR